LGSPMEGTAEAEAGVLTGIEAMRSGLIEVIAESMMTGTTIMRVAAGDTGAQVLDIGEDEVAAEVLEGGGTIVRLEMAVRRDVPELSNGTGRGKTKNLGIRLMLRKSIMVMLANIMGISSRSRNRNHLRRDNDLFML